MLSLILNPQTGTVSIKHVYGYEEIAHSIDADFFDVVRFRFTDDVTNVYYDFYVDDIGYFKEKLSPSVVPTNYPVLVGTVLIGKSDQGGNEADLSDIDVLKIIRHIVWHRTQEDRAGFAFIKGVSR